jgi:hypothetical protein
MNTELLVQAKHLNIALPTDCFELTTDWTESECWEMSRNGVVTYDEADHMVDGMSLFEARVIVAAYNCDCEICDI